MEILGFAHLQFDPAVNNLISEKKLTDGLSAVAQIGQTLWVANDETVSLERLFLLGQDENGIYQFGNHTSFALVDFLNLPVSPASGDIKEVDIEGLYCADGYLWLVGSHSLKRTKADENDLPETTIRNLTDVKVKGNRFLLARIPLVPEDKPGHFGLKKKVRQPEAERRAAQLPGNEKSSLLTQILKGEKHEEADEHVKDFLAIPGKDNGFDIEGLAVAGNHVFVGLRGPVLRGWAIILELEVEADDEPALLTLRSFERADGEPRRYRKHFFELDGLGIRDLCVQGNDLLIMAGPTMVLDGPVTVFRWRDGILANRESLVFREKLIEVASLPFGKGEDHPEGMTFFSADGLETDALLIVNDATENPLLGRKLGSDGFKADIFLLAR
ncbi:DUF3616 domain-containing protein [Larkinella rosea]|uniref:DUF3616 domain-containing protein n=1 Tax=Larkinella rosea TaxID=2025312 RepID=A0A3P1BIN9_9BACT|nr:DUF3616 domain-containing protein [Larkinella rosea]RRB00842.1 DUF3616 domain-containing protein [Larkinella rosea]